MKYEDYEIIKDYEKCSILEYGDIAYSDNVSNLELLYSTICGTPVDE